MNLNKKEKSAARKRAFRNSQTDEAKADASAQLQARMSALRNSQTEEEKDLASEQLRARMSEDFKQVSDSSYGYVAHDSISQHDDPFAYTELQNIVDNGHYLNLSRARAHFGIEPLTDTILELVMLNESYNNLCYKIAVILLCYRKYFNALNEIQP